MFACIIIRKQEPPSRFYLRVMEECDRIQLVQHHGWYVRRFAGNIIYKRMWCQNLLNRFNPKEVEELTRPQAMDTTDHCLLRLPWNCPETLHRELLLLESDGVRPV